MNFDELPVEELALRSVGSRQKTGSVCKGLQNVHVKQGVKKSVRQKQSIL